MKLLAPGWFDEARAVIQAQLFRQVLRGSGGLTGRCLNAGSGEGLYVPFLVSQPGLTATVHLDLQHPPGLRVGPSQYLVRGSLTALPFGDQVFEACLCSEVLEHISDDQQAMAELGRVLTPGGLLLLSTPTPPAPADPHHLREGYTLEALTAPLTRSGFDLRNACRGFYLPMRWLYHLWQWQFRLFGREQRSFFPRGLLYVAVFIEQRLRIGRPWNLVLLAEKRRG